MSRKQWRCFHCDQVFRSEREAAIHFGSDEAATCACVLPHEQHLVEHIRDLQRQLDDYRSESDNIMKSIVSLESEHQRALRRAEENGYDKGVRDMSTEAPR